MISDEQFQALANLRSALLAAEAVFPGEAILKALHGSANLAVLAGKSRMTDSQYRTLGGGTDKGN